MSMLGQALADRAGEHVECSEQCGRAVPFTVVGHRLASALTIGGDSCVRSSACTEDFSSAHSTLSPVDSDTTRPRRPTFPRTEDYWRA